MGRHGLIAPSASVRRRRFAREFGAEGYAVVVSSDRGGCPSLRTTSAGRSDAVTEKLRGLGGDRAEVAGEVGEALHAAIPGLGPKVGLVQGLGRSSLGAVDRTV